MSWIGPILLHHEFFGDKNIDPSVRRNYSKPIPERIALKSSGSGFLASLAVLSVSDCQRCRQTWLWSSQVSLLAPWSISRRVFSVSGTFSECRQRKTWLRESLVCKWILGRIWRQGCRSAREPAEATSHLQRRQLLTICLYPRKHRPS